MQECVALLFWRWRLKAPRIKWKNLGDSDLVIIRLENMAPQQPSSMEEQSGELCEPESEEGEKQGPGSPSDAPDGGWGWVVLVATILVLALTLAFPACIGIFYLELQEEFQASNSETSWVPSIMTSVLHAGGEDVIGCLLFSTSVGQQNEIAKITIFLNS